MTPVIGNILLYELRRFRDDQAVTLTTDIQRPYEDGAPFLVTPRSIPHMSSFQLGDELKPSFEVTFDSIPEVDGRNVITFLHACSDDVTSAMNGLHFFLP